MEIIPIAVIVEELVSAEKKEKSLSTAGTGSVDRHGTS